MTLTQSMLRFLLSLIGANNSFSKALKARLHSFIPGIDCLGHNVGTFRAKPNPLGANFSHLRHS